MRKLLALFLAIAMVMSTSAVAFAADSSQIVNEERTVESTDTYSLPGVDTHDLTYYISYHQDSQMCDTKASQQFTVSSRINLKLIMSSEQTVKVYVYNVRTGQYLTLSNGLKYVTVTGGAPASTISLKNSCPTGTYRLELHTSYSELFYAIYTVCGAQYV